MNGRLRLHQGGPRGAARHRRRLHERHRRAHRAGRLAHDVLPDARRPTVFLWHLLPQSCFSAASFGGIRTWRDRRDEVEQTSDQIAAELRSMTRTARGGPPVDPALLRPRRRRGVARRGHRARRIRRRAEIPTVGVARGAAAALGAHRLAAGAGRGPPSGAAMARGGMYDQLAGGFARYSVDNAWVVPHFEKMLYDNALLLRV